MEIKVITETEYGMYIESYFKKEFPSTFKSSASELLEILSEILINTKEVRYGAIPIPEHLVVVRDVIRESINQGVSIPILVPFGGIKGDRSSNIDIAELNVVKQLMSLDDCIKKYFPPGITVNIRMEDLGAVWLYGDDYTETIQKYTWNMQKLASIIKCTSGSNINAISEWSLMKDKESYFKLSAKYSESLEEYLVESDGKPDRIGKGRAFELLKILGWNGEIPFEQREHYYKMYQKLEPGISHVMEIKKLADYFGGSKARYDLKGIASPDYLQGKYIQLSYVQPIPGAPSTMTNRTLYYRTLPLSEARSHMPAWRAKGYLKIDSKGGVKAKITSWNDKETIEQLTKSQSQIGDKDLSVTIQSDYLLE